MFFFFVFHVEFEKKTRKNFFMNFLDHFIFFNKISYSFYDKMKNEKEQINKNNLINEIIDIQSNPTHYICFFYSILKKYSNLKKISNKILYNLKCYYYKNISVVSFS